MGQVNLHRCRTLPITQKMFTVAKGRVTVVFYHAQVYLFLFNRKINL